MKVHYFVRFSLAAITCLAAPAAYAHFPWLIRGEDGKVAYFFGEDVSDRTYKLPPSIAAAQVHRVGPEGKLEPVALSSVEKDDFVGLVSSESVPSEGMLISHVTYGIHRGTLLDYYTVHQGGKLPTNREAYKRVKSGLDLNAELVDADSGVDVYVTWKGEPAQGLEVHLYCAEGHEEGSATTDVQGKVSFTDQQVEKGLNGIRLGHTRKESAKLNEAAYDTAAHYLTVTFYDPDFSDDAVASAKFAPLPVGLTSFGAVRAGEAIYVYGGHTGKAHSYSNQSQSNKLLKLDLSKPESAWQEIAEGESLQGLGMVAYKNRLIVLGGFTARNAEGQEHDLHSQASVRAYDLASGQWSDLPSLPEPRSSHDAALIGSSVYVVGGWNLDGEQEANWHTTAWSMDLDATEPRWVELPKPPFQRRALAAVAHQGKLFAIGGMSQEAGPTKAVTVFDPQTKAWTEVAELLGEKPMAGFGAAGWSVEDQLIVTTYEGTIQRWDAEKQNWGLVGQSEDARFFHRLLPLSHHQLISVGGANMESGKFVNLEAINLP